MTTTPAMIAARLTPGQRSTILGLGSGFCVLGCSEPTAARLTKGTAQRPPLVRAQKGSEFREFALNELGLQVRAHLMEQDA